MRWNAWQKNIYIFSSLLLAFFLLSFFIFSTHLSTSTQTLNCDSTNRTITQGVYVNESGTTFASGADLILAVGSGSCTFVLSGIATLSSLTIKNGVTLTHSANTISQVSTLNISTTGDLIIEAGGSIDISRKGYSGGAVGSDGYGSGKGLGGNNAIVVDDASGAGHGGSGGADGDSDEYIDAGGSAYCSETNPASLGSGGGGAPLVVGGAGGGLVTLAIDGNITINGTIVASGGDGQSGATGHSGAGAGGGVHLVGDVISGSGTITALGGDSQNGGAGGGGCIYIGYRVSNSFSSSTAAVAGGVASGVGNNGSNGTYYIEQLNVLPIVASISPNQVDANTVSFSTTISDENIEETNMYLEYSLDGSSWISLATYYVTPDEGAVTTSTGNITGIDTNIDGDINITIRWNVGADISNVEDDSAYIRLIPYDAQGNGSTVTSSLFAIDTKSPTSPGPLTIFSTSTNAADIAFGSVSSDINFYEYTLFYVASSDMPTTSDISFTSSSDSNLSDISYNSAATTTLAELATSTQYSVNIWAYDSFGRSSSSTSALMFYTLADAPGQATVSSVSTSSLNIIINTSTNPSTVEYSICRSQDDSTCMDGGYVNTSGNFAASVSWNTYNDWGGNSGLDITDLSANTQYIFLVKARNGDNIETVFSSATAGVYTYANAASISSVDETTTSTLNIAFSASSNATSTTYAIIDTNSGSYVSADNSLSASTAVWQTTSTWGTPTITGLYPNTQYVFGIIAKNSDNVTSATTTASSIYTYAVAPSVPTVSVVSTSTILMTFVNDSNPSATTYAIYETDTGKYVDISNDLATTTAVWQTQSAWNDPMIDSLSANTAYTFALIAKNGDGVLTSTTTASELYTYATNPTSAAVSNVTTSTLDVTFDANSNPSNTVYALYEANNSAYVDTDYTVSSDTSVWQTASAWGDVTLTSLTPNAGYTIGVIGRNGENIDTATSTADATYTNPTIPTSVSMVQNGQTSLVVSWDKNSNATSSVFALYDSGNTLIATTTDNSYTVTGLTANTAYQYLVKTQYKSNSANYTAFSATSTAVSTAAVQSSVSMALPASASTTFKLSETDETHTLTVQEVGETSATLLIQSTPVTVRLSIGESTTIDSDANGSDDMQVTLNGISSGSADVNIVAYTPNGSSSSGSSGSAFMSSAHAPKISFLNGRHVTVHPRVWFDISWPDARDVAVSLQPTFMGVSYQPYTERTWFEIPKQGKYMVYVRVRNEQGNTYTAAYPVEYNPLGYSSQECPVESGYAYTYLGDKAVWYVTKDCQRQLFKSEEQYFSYFSSWEDVKIIKKLTLLRIEVDARGIMPMGPLYDIQNGSMIKTIDSPHVYIVLDGMRQWINTLDIFDALHYQRSWIVDVSDALLQKYARSEDIDYTDHHPINSFVTYRFSPEIYHIEAGSADNAIQIKRRIGNNTVLDEHHFDWERIVTIDESEVYEDGDLLE